MCIISCSLHNTAILLQSKTIIPNHVYWCHKLVSSNIYSHINCHQLVCTCQKSFHHGYYKLVNYNTFIMVLDVDKLVYPNTHVYIGTYKFAYGNNQNLLQNIDKNKQVFLQYINVYCHQQTCVLQYINYVLMYTMLSMAINRMTCKIMTNAK